MNAVVFSGRNFKELLRNPASLLCGVGIPAALIIALSLMQKAIPGMSAIFAVDTITPSMAIFGLAFLSMFLGSLMTGDKKQSFLMRLFTSPMKSFDYIAGYSLPVLPLAILQTLLCFTVGFVMGMDFNVNILVAIVVLLPITILFISFGLFVGSALTSDNQISGFMTLFINATIFLGGAVIPLDIMGKTFKTICYFLPFAHANDALWDALQGDVSATFPHLLWVCCYAVALFIIAVIIFRKRMKQ